MSNTHGGELWSANTMKIRTWLLLVRHLLAQTACASLHRVFTYAANCGWRCALLFFVSQQSRRVMCQNQGVCACVLGIIPLCFDLLVAPTRCGKLFWPLPLLNSLSSGPLHTDKWKHGPGSSLSEKTFLSSLLYDEFIPLLALAVFILENQFWRK